MTTTRRCIDMRLGEKVLSYDLLEGEEKAEVDRHLETCVACRDLKQQIYGNAGALAEIEYRAFRLSQRQRVSASAWLLRRLRDLWVPVTVAVILVSALLLYLARRGPDPVVVGIVHLSASRSGYIDTTGTVPVPVVSPVPNSLFIQPDREALAFVYEADDESFRRLLPPAGGPPLVLMPDRLQEILLPPVRDRRSRVLLVLTPRGSPADLEAWDQAVYARLGGPTQGDRRHWPGNARATIRWIH